MTFRNAVIISIALHAAAIGPLWKAYLPKPPVAQEAVVEYLVLKEPVRERVPVKDAEVKVPETPKIELKPKVETAPAPDAPTDKAEAGKDEARELAQRQAQARTTKDYINYYQLLREKIRQRVKHRYKNSYNEGEVRLNFTLSSKGAVVSCSVDRSLPVDAGLAELAILSVREASPFPPFPESLQAGSMAFNVTVVFKKERP